MLAILPDSLAAEIKERYETLGDKYLSDKFHTDGRQINGMMFTDRIINCKEEVVDAVFCILGQIFKETVKGIEPSENMFPMLYGLIQVYSLLSLEYVRGNYS